VIALGTLSLLAAAITLIGFKIASTNYLNGLPDQQFEPADQVVYQAFYTPLQHSLWWAMLAAAILTVLGLLAAPFHWSQAVRTALHLPQLQTTQAYRAWTTARVWIRQYRLWFWGGLLALALIIMLTIPNLTTATAVIILSLALIAGAAVQLVASPQATTVLD
ncbi:MAG TPA: hypothetical protein VLF67_04235, partial [Candidatus Saccharimonas sp.]|nr:hypothetical protein [Candidatus Saccharimonas sp.]